MKKAEKKQRKLNKMIKLQESTRYEDKRSAVQKLYMPQAEIQDNIEELTMHINEIEQLNVIYSQFFQSNETI